MAQLGSAGMQRLCGRPGCSDLASVAYGMRAADLVFWLDVLPEVDSADHGMLCARHADSMVVPRGWTLDDLRDPDLHLFRPPSAAERVRPTGLARPRATPNGVEQLRLSDASEPADEAAPVDEADVVAVADVADVVREVDALDETATVADGPDPVDDPGPWTPSFDEADDLDGLLSARSPLLSRAFRTADRVDE